MKNEDKYDDIINLPHHVSKKHPPLKRASYAAQFSPFAALTGYDGIVSEAARITDERIELNETDMEIINAKLQIVCDRIKEKPELTVTYFVADKKKSGGKFLKTTASARRIDDVERVIYFTDGTKLPFDDIIDIQSGIFDILKQGGEQS